MTKELQGVDWDVLHRKSNNEWKDACIHRPNEETISGNTSGVDFAYSFAPAEALTMARERGTSYLGIDDSSRAYTQYNAPVMAAVTATEHGKLYPLAIMVTNDRDAAKWQLFLSTFKAVSCAFAAAFVFSRFHSSVVCLFAATNLLFVQAIEAKTPGGEFSPAVVTIDKDAGELKAVRAVFPKAQISLCWFHIKQALK